MLVLQIHFASMDCTYSELNKIAFQLKGYSVILATSFFDTNSYIKTE